jgi:hypothetical protein
MAKIRLQNANATDEQKTKINEAVKFHTAIVENMITGVKQ